MKGSKRKRAAQASKEAPAEIAVAVEQVEQPTTAAEVAVEIPAPAPADSGTEATTVAIVLQVNCSVRDVIEFRNSLLDVIASETPVIIDAAQIERIDTAALQVLAAFVRERRAQEREVTWLRVNDLLSEAARTLGLAASLGIPESRAEAA